MLRTIRVSIIFQPSSHQLQLTMKLCSSYSGACWAFALVASVEAAYGIAMNAEAPQLSVESLFAAMGLTSEADKCITGGSPTEALERLLTLPRGSITEAGSPVSSVTKEYPVHGFERTRFKGFVGLMLAVRRQPVVVHIEACGPDFAQYDGTFKYLDPGCYTGKLNHVVLVVGYFVLRNDGSQNRIAPPFWILRNSWGVEWGDRGHMRMDIQGGDGVCGINVLPGIYPIVKMDVCGSDLKNLCYVGACINDAKGSYSCICPPNYVASKTIDNFPTCDPANATASTLVVSGSNWWCSDVLPVVGLSLAQFTQQNAVSSGDGEAARVERLPYILSHCSTLQGDTCWSISAQLFLTTSNLTALNPGLNCPEPIKAGRSLCIERNATFAYTVPRCLQYGVLTAQDTCERLLLQVAGSEDDPTGAGKENATRWAELYRNNPGLICSSVIPVSASTVGSSTGVQNKNYSSSQPVLPPASVLTKGTQRETGGNFTAAPVTLFVYEAGQTVLGCGLQLAFHANFTFSLSPRSGRVGFNGFAFVVSATDRVGSGAGVGYGGMDKRSMAVEFDTLQNKKNGDLSSQHVGLNIRGEDKSVAAVRSPFPLSNRKAYTAWVDYEPGDPGTIQVFLADSQEKPQEALLERRLALCEVLQGAAERPAFFFGFVASTTVKPFQRHVILESTVDTGKKSVLAGQ
ncbi:unnamed protein product [Closterium sp. Yama58-4]|nr:unnamed protein product [Closterium sp. Yama58-4]